MNTLIYRFVNPHIACIEFNRPMSMNSLNNEMASELYATLEQVEQNEELRVLILQGAGNQFMAGGDIGFFYQHLNDIGEQAKVMIQEVHQTIKKITELDKLVIASVHGAVAGIGISYMLAADLVIAAEQTKFTTAYSAIGASPDGGMTYHLTRHLGMKKAMELLILSDRFDAAQAHSLGMLNFVVPDMEREAMTLKLAERIAKGPQKSFKQIKKLVRVSSSNTLDNQLKLEEGYFIEAAGTRDFATGVSAFVRKEKPEFTG